MLAIPACDRPRGALYYGCARLHGMVQVPGQEEIHGAQQSTVVVPLCSPGACCMLTAAVALPLIFPR